MAYGKILIAEPSYVAKLKKVKSRGKIIRCICIMDHPIPKTKDVPSAQIILPQRQIGRNNGKYFLNFIDKIYFSFIKY
jgi:Rab GDP dissociation inhibitor